MVKRLSRSPGLGPRRSPGIAKPSGTLHRGRKKRLEAQEKQARKKEFIEAELGRLAEEAERKRERLRKERGERGDGGLKEFSGLLEALPELEGNGKKVEGEGKEKGGFVGHRRRRRLAVEEGVQIRMVREHEVFKRDPVEALRQHLENSVGAAEVPIGPGKGGFEKGGKKGREVKRKEVNRKEVNRKEGKRKEQASAKEERKAEVAERRSRKQALLLEAGRISKQRKGDQVRKQTAVGLLGGRGRIGEKRRKMLE